MPIQCQSNLQNLEALYFASNTRMSFPPIPGVASIPFPFFWSFPSLFVMPFQELRRQLPQWRSLRGSCPQFDLFFSIWSPILSMMPAWSLLVFSWHVMIFADFPSGFKMFRPFPDLTLTFSVFALFPRHFRSLSTSFSQSWSYECCGTDLQACGREWRAENLGCPDESYTWWHGQTGRNVCHLSAAWSLGSCLSRIYKKFELLCNELQPWKDCKKTALVAYETVLLYTTWHFVAQKPSDLKISEPHWTLHGPCIDLAYVTKL